MPSDFGKSIVDAITASAAPDPQHDLETAVGFDQAADDPRPLHVIGAEMATDWAAKPSGIYFGAQPYLVAMRELSWMSDMYYEDSAYDIVLRLLINARYYRGPVAKRIKKELNERLKASR